MNNDLDKAISVGYNVALYGNLIQPQLPFWSSKLDLIWLANQFGNILRRKKYETVDNIRACRAGLIFGTPSSDYRRRVREGCCGVVDKMVKNPLTGNRFWIGFNHGH